MIERLLVAVFLLLICTSSSKRTFAVGDLHGDLPNTLRILRLLSIIDSAGNWIAGDSVLLQTGDVVDRGPHSRDILDLLARLRLQAEAAGGRLIQLLGNHELMAFKGRTKYTHKGDLDSFGGANARFKAFAPDGAYGYVRAFDSVVILNGTLFVHAGLTPELAKSHPDSLNVQVRRQVALGNWRHLVLADDGPSWSRLLIRQAERGQCDTLVSVLRQMERHVGHPIDQMIVGHTIQYNHKINRFCNDSLVALDISISSFMGLGQRNLAAIELKYDETRRRDVVEIIYPQNDSDATAPIHIAEANGRHPHDKSSFTGAQHGAAKHSLLYLITLAAVCFWLSRRRIYAWFRQTSTRR